ncbi:MAG: hypothetical protein EXR59_03990 [Dehalococcoidia bacterium]|nr:hypothetical protein [Dehalococcoidia bacterium]
MCGRYSITSSTDVLRARFGFDVTEGFDYKPSYNVAPTDLVPAVLNQQGRKGMLMKWGLIPYWSKDGKPSFSTINARVEALATAPTFKVRRKYAFNRPNKFWGGVLMRVNSKARESLTGIALYLFLIPWWLFWIVAYVGMVVVAGRGGILSFLFGITLGSWIFWLIQSLVGFFALGVFALVWNVVSLPFRRRA